MAHVAGARLAVLGLDSGLAGDALQRVEQSVEGGALAVGDVDDLAHAARRLGGAEVRVHDVRDVCEVARLLAVAVDDGPRARHQRVNEARDDAGILGAGVLAGAEDVEVA